jgi:outer membrane protein assembly factor BamB
MRKLPQQTDPGNASYGYTTSGWSVSRISGSGLGQPVWTLSLHPPRGVPGSEPDLDVLPQYGYTTVVGGNRGQYITAVSAKGQAGPACVLPEFAATDRPVDLLPHVGVVVLGNPPEPEVSTGSNDQYWLDGYSTSTGKRLWSVPTGRDVSENSADFMVDKDTVYNFNTGSGQVEAYAAATGQHLWTTSFGFNGNTLTDDNGLLAASGGLVYAMVDATTRSEILAVNGVNGDVVWKRSVPVASSLSDVTVSPIAPGQLLLADSDSNKAYLLDPHTGATLAAEPVQLSGKRTSPPELCDPNGQRTVAFSENGHIVTLAAAPGDTGTFAIASGDTSVATSGTIAYVRAEQADAPVRGYSLATGKLLWTVPDPHSGADGILFSFEGGFEVQDDPGTILYR